MHERTLVVNGEVIRVLIVDDRPENLLAMENLLESPDLVILRAESGAEALSILLLQDIALVLLDVQMPDMDGFEVAELMRSNTRTKTIPIIFVTAISKEKKYVFKGYKSGAVDYLFKPINPDILISKVTVFCNLYRQRILIEQQKAKIEKQNRELKKQLKEIKTLEGLIPICSHCKKVRDEDGDWGDFQDYVRAKTLLEYSHGLCPDCAKSLYPETFGSDEDLK